jgi:hypothetical protein
MWTSWLERILAPRGEPRAADPPRLPPAAEPDQPAEESHPGDPCDEALAQAEPLAHAGCT